MAPAGQSSGIVMAVALVAAMAWEILHAMAKAKKKMHFIPTIQRYHRQMFVLLYIMLEFIKKESHLKVA